MTVIRAFYSLRFLLNDIQNTVFKGFFVLAQSVLFPCEIKDFVVKVVTDQTPLKHVVQELIVWFFFEL